MKKPARKYSFRKSERLCSRKEIERLFADGSSIIAYPLKLIFLKREEITAPPTQIMFVVPKRNFRKAHDRNRLRRRTREAFRLAKPQFNEKLTAKNQSLYIAILYTSKKEEDYCVVETACCKLLEKLLNSL